MEFTKEFIEDQKLTEDQMTAINGQVTNHVADVKKEYDGKANADAEGILNGAATSISDKLEIERNKGEKIADFILRVTDKRNEVLKAEAEEAKNEYLEKAKNVKGNEGITKELEDLKLKHDEALQKFADYDTLKETAGKFTGLSEDHSKMKLEVSFGQVKPNFPDTVNKYEAATKWGEFKTKLLTTHTIELVDGVPMVIDKENQYKTEKLEDVVAKNAELTELLKGRQQNGPNAKPSETHNVDGVPFPVPVNATTKERAEAIKEYLNKQPNLSVTDDRYSKLFTDYNNKIQAQKNAA